jgi:hypothetical protein
MGFELPDRWQTYRNPRFGFEFLYPDGWLFSIPPENQDGMAFNDPRNPAVEIRGWASLIRNLPSEKSKALTSVKPNSVKPSGPMPVNFTTEQGLASNLSVQIEKQVSSLELTLTQGGVQYRWRGTAPSQQFDDYYRFFYFVASRYRLPK